MTISINGTSGIVNDATDLNYTGTLTGGTGVVNLGSGQVYKDASGNVGIGTSSPTDSGAYGKALDVQGSGGSAVYVRSTTSPSTNYGYVGFTGGAGNLDILNNPAGNIRFYNNGAERARIDSSGNLLVGTTSAGDSKIVFLFSGTSVGLTLQDSINNSNAYFHAFRNSSGTIIGSVTRVTTTNAVVYNTTSDYRLKTVTGAVTGQGERIDALKPVDYIWTDGGQKARGFLAHEFQEVYLNSVTGDKDAVDANGNPKHQSMQAATSEVIADLVAEIQSLRKRLVALEQA